MIPAVVIAKKRDGHELSREEVAAFMHGFARGEVPDYQMAALAMAIFLRGMTNDETAALTDEMLASGVRMQWTPGGTPKVDKHSTGGIGDKTSLILAPLLACCGLAVPMISGRGLGPTGGTLDKLEAIPGFRTDLSLAEIDDVVRRVGCVVTGASAEIAPADRKLYALRDVTATVPSIPLITASIMSKKLAESLDALVLDVKFGNGAFMKSLADARQLAESLVATGRRMGVKTTALLTDMNQPLGRMVGNAVEVYESLDVLGGGGPSDLVECTLALGAELLLSVGKATTLDAALAQLNAALASGRALEKFRQMIAAQGGDLRALPPLRTPLSFDAAADGYLAAVDTEAIGLIIIALGGGRKFVGQAIDHGVGLEVLVRVGDRVEAGQPIIQLYASPAQVDLIRSLLTRALCWSSTPIDPLPLIVERIGD